LYEGDRVLVRNVGLKGTNKLTDIWKEDVYVVVAQPDSEIPVYQVTVEQGTGRHNTLHRNLLLSIGHIPLVEDSVSSSSVDSGSLTIPVPTVSSEYDDHNLMRIVSIDHNRYLVGQTQNSLNWIRIYHVLRIAFARTLIMDPLMK
jgi:hypothetical protein